MESDAERRRRTGKAIIDRRGQLGIKSQKELASKAQVDASLIQELEAGQIERRRNLSHLASISTALERPSGWLRELLYGDDPQPDRLTALEEAGARVDARLAVIETRLDEVCLQLLSLLRRDDD